MPKQGFFLNYGGPGGVWFSSKPSAFSTLDEECKKNYGPPTRTVSFSAQGLQVKVLTYGIHRALYVELPENASVATHHLYQLLGEESLAFCDKDYGILHNNCVTAVTAILYKLDPTIVPEYLVFPWTLDAALKKSLDLNNKTEFMQPFFELYEQKSNRKTYFSFMSQRSKLHALKSLQDVISDAYYGEQQEREKTKSSLIELNWVSEDEQGILHPTTKAPKEFSIGLLAFNYDYRTVTQLKFIVSVQDIDRTLLNAIFQDNPDFATASERVKNAFMLSYPSVYTTISTQITNWQEENPYDAEELSSDCDSDENDSTDNDTFNS